MGDAVTKPSGIASSSRTFGSLRHNSVVSALPMPWARGASRKFCPVGQADPPPSLGTRPGLRRAQAQPRGERAPEALVAQREQEVLPRGVDRPPADDRQPPQLRVV